MAIQHICSYIGLAYVYAVAPHQRAFCLPQDELSSEERKTLSTAVAWFNLSIEEPHLCTLKAERINLATRHELGLANQWIALAAFVANLALSVLFIHTPPYSPTFSLMCFGVSLFALKHFAYASESIPGDYLKVTVEILKDIRVLPAALANNYKEEKQVYIDPVTLDEIQKAKVCARRYLHVANYILGISSYLKTLLEHPLVQDEQGRSVLRHPLEDRTLSYEESSQVVQQIVETLGLSQQNMLNKEGANNQTDEDRFYDLWKVDVPQEKVEQFREECTERFACRVSFVIIGNVPLEVSGEFFDEEDFKRKLQTYEQHQRLQKFITQLDPCVIELLPYQNSN